MEAGRTPVTKREIIIVASVLIALLLFVMIMGMVGGKADSVRVIVNGSIVKELKLSEDSEYMYTDESGFENLIVIKDGKIFVESANCRDGLCVHQGKKDKAGQSIVCLPHHMVIELVGGSGEADAYAK